MITAVYYYYDHYFWAFIIGFVFSDLSKITSVVSMMTFRWFKGNSASPDIRLDDKTVIITGCNTGIGKETAKDIAQRGARIIMACRDLTKTDPVAEEIRKETGATVVVHQLNLADFQSIHNFSKIILETEPKINILINNAGVMMCPQWITEDGFEMHFGTNHLGHFLLTMLLLDRIKESAPARIINVSSVAHILGKIHWDDINMDKNYNARAAYCQSKLANILFTRELAKQLTGTGVNVYAVHPGVVNTELNRHLGLTTNRFIDWLFSLSARYVFRTPVQGAQTTIFCAVAEELNDKTGLYYSDCAEKQPSNAARDDVSAKRLWDLSMELTKLKKGDSDVSEAS